MLQRNLLYTGVTRGKKLVVLVGQKKAIAIAVRNVSGRKRWSKLSEWLRPKPPVSRRQFRTAGIHRRAFSWNGASPCGAESCPGLTGSNPIWKPKARHYPLWAAPTVSGTRAL